MPASVPSSVTHSFCLGRAPHHLRQALQSLSPPLEASSCPCPAHRLPSLLAALQVLGSCLHRVQGTQACLELARSPAPPYPRFILLELSSHLSIVLLVAWGQAASGRKLRSRGEGATYRDSQLGRGRDEATAQCHLQAPACLGRHALVPSLTLSACSSGTSSLLGLWALPSWDQAWHSLFPPVHSGPDSSSLAHSRSLGVLA